MKEESERIVGHSLISLPNCWPSGWRPGRSFHQWLKRTFSVPFRSGLEPRPPKELFARLLLAFGAMEFAHEMGERLDRVEAHRVVERDAHPADRAVPGRADKICRCGLLGEFFF